jgi:hypothetical protein
MKTHWIFAVVALAVVGHLVYLVASLLEPTRYEALAMVMGVAGVVLAASHAGKWMETGRSNIGTLLVAAHGVGLAWIGWSYLAYGYPHFVLPVIILMTASSFWLVAKEKREAREQRGNGDARGTAPGR